MLIEFPKTLEQRLRYHMTSDALVVADDVHAEISELDSLSLGRLMAQAWRTCKPFLFSADGHYLDDLHPEFRFIAEGCDRIQYLTAAGVARRILVCARQESPPRYDADSTRDMLLALLDSDISPRTEKSASAHSIGDALDKAAQIVELMADGLTDEHRHLLGQLTQKPWLPEGSPLRVALAIIAGLSVPAAPAPTTTTAPPLRHMELDCIAHMAVRQPHAALEVARELDPAYHYRSTSTDDEAADAPLPCFLAQFPEFVEAAQPAITAALTWINLIQQGAIPYAADKALPYDDAHALARFVNIALDHHESWLEPLLQPLLLGVAIAPIATAKTAPSQAAAMSIAKAISDCPTIASLATLKAVIPQVRHAGVSKKLQKFLKAGERRLAASPNLLSGLPPDFVVPKSLLGAFKKSFENLYLNRRAFTRQIFETKLLATKGISEMAQALIWTTNAEDGAAVSAQAVKTRSGFEFLDAHGAKITLASDAVFRLWHPLTAAAADLADWQTRILASGVRQPFNQAFRETYHLPPTVENEQTLNLFADYVVDVRILIGVAQSAGWRLTNNDEFQRSVNELCFAFACNARLYPGAEGAGQTGDLHVARHTRYGEPVTWGEIAPEIVSEILRSADLLTSVAAFAANPEEAENLTDYFSPGAHAAQSRHEVLRRLFGEEEQANRPWVDGRYVRMGDINIHIATGQARRAGAPLELTKPKGTIPLPYDDVVLEKIVGQINGAIKGQ
ncbi:MAG: DUF4132 domain-containing protein [Methylobacillus sp.]|jgi:hypothetical protein|nr:DUF4132 domain-containing protein [Methylobacillus sp.]